VLDHMMHHIYSKDL